MRNRDEAWLNSIVKCSGRQNTQCRLRSHFSPAIGIARTGIQFSFFFLLLFFHYRFPFMFIRSALTLLTIRTKPFGMSDNFCSDECRQRSKCFSLPVHVMGDICHLREILFCYFIVHLVIAAHLYTTHSEYVHAEQCSGANTHTQTIKDVMWELRNEFKLNLIYLNLEKETTRTQRPKKKHIVLGVFKTTTCQPARVFGRTNESKFG